MKVKNAGYFLIVVISGLMLYLFLGILSSQYREDYRLASAKELLKSNRIAITEGFGYPDEITLSEYLSGENAFQNIQAAYSELADMGGFRELYPVLVQKIGEYNGDKKFIDYYENIPEDELNKYVEQEVQDEEGNEIKVTNVKGVLLSEKMAQEYQINQQITTGEMFSGEDYQLKEKTVPVLLGYAYRNQYKIGDIIHSLYNGIKMEFKIKGFLEKGAFVDFGNELIPLDYHIVIPAFEVSESQYAKGSVQEKFAYATQYLIKINAEVICEDEKAVSRLLAVLDNVKIKYQIPIYYDNVDEAYDTNRSIMESLTVSRDNMILAMMEMVILSFGMLLVFILSFKKEKKDYAVRLLCGASLSNIKKVVFGRFLAILLAGYAISAVVFFWQKRMEFAVPVMQMSLRTVLYLVMGIWGISSIIANFYINRTEVYLALRDE